MLLTTLLIGLIAGFAAGKIMKGKGFGFIVNILLGLAGALVGKFLFEKMGIVTGYGFLSAVLQSMIGAIVILAIANVLSGGRS